MLIPNPEPPIPAAALSQSFHLRVAERLWIIPIMLTVVAIVAVILAPAPPAAADKPSIAGAWTMNKDQSDAVPTRSDESGGERGGGQRGGYGGGGRHGGYGGGRGGHGGGPGSGGGGGGGGRAESRRTTRDGRAGP